MKNLNINVVFASVIAIIVAFIVSYKPENNTIYTTGKCIKKVQKDRFGITVTIKNLEKTTTDATRKTLNTYKEISEFLKTVQSENPDVQVETTEYTTNEKTRWNNKINIDEKLGVESIISIAISTSKPEVLSDITFNFTRFNDVFTSKLNNFVSTEVYQKEKSDCLEDAIRDAKRQAEKLASAIGQKVGKMVHSDYRNYSTSSGGYYMAKAVRGMSANDTLALSPAEMFSGSEDISVSVDATFELK
ncbi:MAG: SIMPL domain-containing protein [Alphaproteobacteria bacterium]|nr:SIMPL domain-containing protein [Alphaproteobacteria bacterium]